MTTSKLVISGTNDAANLAELDRLLVAGAKVRSGYPLGPGLLLIIDQPSPPPPRGERSGSSVTKHESGIDV